MPPISVPTTSALPPSRRIPSANPAVFRILSKLSRLSLLSLILDWLDDRNQVLSAPHLATSQDDEDAQDLYPPAHSLDELREYYTELQARKGGKREVIDRVIEGDWRNGLSLYQLAMADMQFLYDHPMSQKWTALRVIQLKAGENSNETPAKDDELPCIPRFHPPTFLQNLQHEVLPDVKAHYNLDRHKSLPLLLLRICILDSPYNTSLALSSSGADILDSSKTIYIAFPDASPHLFVSLTTSAQSPTSSKISTAPDTRSLRKILLDGLPKAFSRPRARYTLQSTNLSAKSLESLISRRGKGRTNAAGGGWGVYASAKRTDTPLNTQLPTPPAEKSDDELDGKIDSLSILSKGMKRKLGDDEDKTVIKRRKLVARSRFGDSGIPDDGKGIERFDVRLEDPFPAIKHNSGDEDELAFSDDEGGHLQEGGEASKKRKGRRSAIAMELELESRKEISEDLIDWAPDIVVTFHGSHIFAGIRELVERGVVDGERMPGWMTGEEGVSVGVVREGRIKGFKGSCI